MKMFLIIANLVAAFRYTGNCTLYSGHSLACRALQCSIEFISTGECAEISAENNSEISAENNAENSAEKSEA